MIVRIFLLLLLLGINGSFAYSLIWGDTGFFEYKELEAQYMILEKKHEQLLLEQRALSEYIRSLQTDDAFLESIIREVLNYIKSDEILYIFDEHNITPLLEDLSNESKN